MIKLKIILLIAMLFTGSYASANSFAWWFPPAGYDAFFGNMDPNWNNVGNWTSPSIPGGVGAKVCFGYIPEWLPQNNPSVCDFPNPKTVGNIIFLGDKPVILQNFFYYSLTLDNGASDSTIDVIGNNIINAPVILHSNLIITGSGTLDLSGGISGSHTVNVIIGNVTTKNMFVDTLIVGSGAIVTIRPNISGPLSGTITPVPEPSMFVLLSTIGLLVLSSLFHRKSEFTVGTVANL